ncbi:MAG: helix-hairpin-helix domain-containing protein, partial [Solirubrobacterales bacterium]
SPEPPPPATPAAGDQSIREAAEREALARLAEAERRSDAERAGAAEAPAVEQGAGAPEEAEERIERARAEPAGTAAPEPRREALLAELQRTEEQLEQHRAQEQELARELTDTEQRIAANRRRTEEALERAASRLQEVEARAAEAEERAQRAEELTKADDDELEKTDRLREMLDRIAEAEQRASSAEQRARAAVEQAAQAVPEIDAGAIEEEATDPEPPHGDPLLDPGAPPGAAEQTPEWFSTSLDPEQLPADPEPAAGTVSINSADYEELRGLGLSVTQTGRVLAERDRAGGFSTLDDLDRIPGLPATLLEQLKRRLTL